MPAIFGRQNGPIEPPTQEYLDESNTASILAITGAFGFAALLVVLLRLYIRIFMLRYVGLDDYAMTLAALMAVGTFVCLCGESPYGMGRHFEWQKPWMFEPLFRWLFAHGLMVMLGVVLVKISVAFFLMRIMLQKGWRIFLWCSVVFLTCFALACSGTLLFQCSPIRASWSITIRLDPKTHCFTNKTYSSIGLFNSIVNILTDILFAVLPIPVVLKLQVNRRTKTSLLIVLSLGFFACVAGILKARLQVSAISNRDAAFENRFQIWYMLELCLGILASSLPTLKPLFTAVLEGTRSRLGTRSRSRATGGAYAVSGRTSGLRPSCGAASLNDPKGDVEMRQYNRCNSNARTTVIGSEGVASSSDVDAGKSPYDVRVVGGRLAVDGNEHWNSYAVSRGGSEERLTSGIYKRVDTTYTSEVKG